MPGETICAALCNYVCISAEREQENRDRHIASSYQGLEAEMCSLRGDSAVGKRHIFSKIGCEKD